MSSQKINFNYLNKEFKNISKIIKDWKKLIKKNSFTLGEYVEKAEKAISKEFKIKYCIGVNSGTDALILCLKSLNISAGEEVITSVNTFYATVGAIVAVGAKPILIDSDDRYQINDKLIENKISKKTKAVIAVHWGGASPNLEKIKRICETKKLYLIEDACMAMGGKVNKKYAGSIGDVSAFSLHPLKTINAMGDGGFFLTKHKKLYEWALKYRNHGMVDRDNISMWGVNMRLQPLQAVVFLNAIKKLKKIIIKRNKNSYLLDSYLRKIKQITLPNRITTNTETYSLYMVIVEKRDQLLNFLNKKGIEAKIHYPKHLAMQNFLKKDYKNYKQDFPVATFQSQHLITIPIHQYLSHKEIYYIYKVINDFYS